MNKIVILMFSLFTVNAFATNTSNTITSPLTKNTYTNATMIISAANKYGPGANDLHDNMQGKGQEECDSDLENQISNLKTQGATIIESSCSVQDALRGVQLLIIFSNN